MAELSRIVPGPAGAGGPSSPHPGRGGGPHATDHPRLRSAARRQRAALPRSASSRTDLVGRPLRPGFRGHLRPAGRLPVRRRVLERDHVPPSRPGDVRAGAGRGRAARLHDDRDGQRGPLHGRHARLVDSERDTWNPDTADWPTPSPRTRGIVVVHVRPPGRHGPRHGIGRAPGTLGAGGRGRGPRRDLPGPAGREHWPGRLLLVLREQDHHHGRGGHGHDQRRRVARLGRRLRDHAFSDERTSGTSTSGSTTG